MEEEHKAVAKEGKVAEEMAGPNEFADQLKEEEKKDAANDKKMQQVRACEPSCIASSALLRADSNLTAL